MLGSGSKFDTNNHNFFATGVTTPPAPVNAPNKTKGVEKTEEKTKAPSPMAGPSIFTQAREAGRSIAFDDKPHQGYDGHSVGGKFFSPFG